MSRGKVIKFQSFNACRELPVRIYFSTTRRFHYSLDRHPEVEFQLIQKGAGEYCINGTRYPFRRNTLLIIRPKETHQGLPSARCRVEKVCLVFSWKLIKCYLPEVVVDRLPRRVQLSEKTAMRVIMHMHNISEEICAKDENWRTVATRELINLVTLLVRYERAEPGRPVRHSRIRDVLAYIDGHFREQISLPELARRLHLSPSRLSHVFKREMGRGIKRYKLERQMAEAKMLLEREQCPPVRLVAESVGFKDCRLFLRHFKRLIGCTPSEHRKFQTRTPTSSVGVGH